MNQTRNDILPLIWVSSLFLLLAFLQDINSYIVSLGCIVVTIRQQELVNAGAGKIVSTHF